MISSSMIREGGNNVQLLMSLVSFLAAGSVYLFTQSDAFSNSSTSATTSKGSSKRTEPLPDHEEEERSCPWYLFAGDVGGTNTRLALYKLCSSTPILSREYLNSDFITDSGKTFEDELFAPFLKLALPQSDDDDETCKIVACFVCAGPVYQNRVPMTNIGPAPSSDDGTTNVSKRMEIIIDGSALESYPSGPLRHIVRCTILNDFVGLGYGALDLDLDTETIDLRSPHSRSIRNPTGPIVCVGAGTGLGECFLTMSSIYPELGYTCHPSEGGHAEFVPRNELETELLQFLKRKYSQQHRVSVERVVSGRGLANVYEFLATKFPDLVHPQIHHDFTNAGDMQGRVVSVNAKSHGDVLCRRALEIMAGAYGSEVGSAALKFIPTGGLFVTGGLTPKNIDVIRGKESKFMKAYHDKERVGHHILNTIPLFAVMVEDLGLRGARICAMRDTRTLQRKRVI